MRSSGSSMVWFVLVKEEGGGQTTDEGSVLVLKSYTMQRRCSLNDERKAWLIISVYWYTTLRGSVFRRCAQDASLMCGAREPKLNA